MGVGVCCAQTTRFHGTWSRGAIRGIVQMVTSHGSCRIVQVKGRRRRWSRVEEVLLIQEQSRRLTEWIERGRIQRVGGLVRSKNRKATFSWVLQSVLNPGGLRWEWLEDEIWAELRWNMASIFVWGAHALQSESLSNARGWFSPRIRCLHNWLNNVGNILSSCRVLQKKIAHLSSDRGA